MSCELGVNNKLGRVVLFSFVGQGNLSAAKSGLARSRAEE